MEENSFGFGYRVRYSCGLPANNKFVDWFIKLFYKQYTIEKDINGIRYIIVYHRSLFWAYEEPTLRLFFSKKLRTWHGQVWEIFPRGGRCGFGTNCIVALFPWKRMKDFLDRESKYVYDACYKK